MISPLQAPSKPSCMAACPTPAESSSWPPAGHQLASAMSGTDPHYGEGDPRQQDLPDPHPAEAVPATRLPDGGLPDIRPAVAHQSPCSQIQRQ